MARDGEDKKRVRFAGGEIPNQQTQQNRTGGGGGGAWVVTMTLCGSFLGLGMCISVLGPTLEDLAKNVQKNISEISYVFVGRATGYIGGSLVGGILFDLVNPHLLLGCAMLMTSLGMCVTPFCNKAVILTLLVSSVGVSMGILDTGGNVLILNTWADQAGPHMQALHFSFAAGAFASPLISKLLFGHESDLEQNNFTGEANANAKVNANANTSHAVSSAPPFLHSTELHLKSMWAYIIIGIFILLVSFFFFFLYCRSSAPKSSSSSSSEQQVFSKHHMLLILLLSVFFFWYVGAEVAYGSFIYTFAKDQAGLDRRGAAGLNSVFWGSFAVCRALSICTAVCLSPGLLIFLSLLGCSCSSLLLVLFSQTRPALWFCSALYGASMASTFPSGISWVEQYTRVTGRSAAAFVVGAALGEMVLPASLGVLLGRVKDQPLLMYLTLITSIITSILFFIMYKLASAGGAAVRRAGAGGHRDADEGDRQALLDSVAEEAEPEEDIGQSEPDLCNDADFELIEMDDTSFINSPNKISVSLPRDTPSNQNNPVSPNVP